MFTRWLVFHVASGQSFFSGIACLLLAVGMSHEARRGWVRPLRNILAGLGGILVAASATPLVPGAYAALVLLSTLWAAGEAMRGRLPRRLIRALRVAFAVAWSIAVLVELPYHMPPRIPPLGRPVMGIVGDSVTAGIDGPGAVTWPTTFAERYGVAVRDHSAMGATVASASRQARAIAPEERLVLLEIGGNDLLGGATPEEFEAGLDGLLAIAQRPGRTLVMLELPLLPGSNRFGLIQRRLARKHEALLVPKRVLLGVLQGGGATLDSIHLSRDGHSRMASAIWGVVGAAYVGD